MSLSLNPQGFPVWQGEPLDLPPKERAVLALLIRRSPEVVGKDEFAAHAWSGAAISDESLTRCISRLRRLHPEVRIESLYGVGYRLARGATPDMHRRLLAAAQAPQPVVDAYLHAHATAARRTPAALQRALTLLRDIVAQHPAYLPARVGLASTLGNLASWGQVSGEHCLQEGMTQLDAAEALAPQDPAVITCRAWLHDLAWRYREADAAYEQALTLAPGDAETLALHGWHRLVTGDAAGAVARLRQAVALQPFAVLHRVVLARALARAGEWDAAEQEIDAAVREHPDSAVALSYQLGMHARRRPAPGLVARAWQLAEQRDVSPLNLGVVSYTLARCGEAEAARELIAACMACSSAGSCTGLLHVAALTALGETEQAAAQVRAAHAAHCGVLPMVLRDPANAELAAHPQVAAVWRAVFGPP